MKPFLIRSTKDCSCQKSWIRGCRDAALVTIICLVAGPAYTQTNSQTTPPAPAEETTIQPETPTPTPSIEPAPSRSERDNQLLARATPEEAQWLDTPHGQILALFRPTESRVTKGALLMLHAAEVPPGWPAPLENLRRNLPQHGWVTLAITLPQTYPDPVPARAPTTAEPTAPEESNAEDPAGEEKVAAGTAEPAEQPTEEPAIPRAELIAHRISAALEFLRAQGQLNLVILVDNSSVHDSLPNLQMAGESAMQALVLTNLQPQEALNKEQLTAIFSSPDLPIMDVFVEPNDEQQRAARKNHRAIAMRNKLNHYHQFSFPPLRQADIDNARSFWLERVRGFMDQNAAGKEIQKNDEE